jgi:hypothetical protein
MPFVTEAQLLDPLESAMGSEAAVTCLAEVLRELGLPRKQLFRAEEAAAIGEAVMGRARHMLQSPTAQPGGA